MNQNRSVATIDAPEFINLQPDAINPGISQCEIKVLYLGKNRNGSYIDKNTAIQMANSLPGTPIVGVYHKDIEDFGDHGDIIHIENGEITFSCATVPYGFVAPDAQVWFQKFTDTDEFDNKIEREYLMTTGYLWTGQYPEVESCITAGKGQSMELDGNSVDGHWATDNNSGIDFFIINDAVFTKLCILGDDVEPCFEGASVTSPEISKNFSYNANFSNTLFSMMNELKFALQNEGGSDMPELEEHLEEQVEETPEVEEAEVEEEVETEAEEAEESETEEDADEEEDSDNEEFACGGGNRKKKYADEDEDEEDKEETPEADSDSQDDEDEKKQQPGTQHSLEDFVALENEVNSMREELESLRQFKLEQENLRKDALINKYHMLSDEDKADIVAHKSEFSYEEIESKLALLYVKKNVDFSTVDGQQEEEESANEDSIFTFSLDSQSAGFVPPMVESLRQAKQSLF